jgi:hypothetical protein
MTREKTLALASSIGAIAPRLPGIYRSRERMVFRYSIELYPIISALPIARVGLPCFLVVLLVRADANRSRRLSFLQALRQITAVDGDELASEVS